MVGRLSSRSRMLPLTAGLSGAVRAWVKVAAALLISGLVVLLSHEAGWLTGSRDALFEDWLYVAVLILAAVVAITRAVLVRKGRWAAMTLAIAILLWTAGEAYYRIVLEPLANPPFPSPSDACWLLFYPAAYTSVVLLVRAQMREFHASVWLDGAIGGLAVAALGATLVLEPVIRATHGSFATVATNIAYPLGDFLLLAFVIGIFALTGWRPGRSFLLCGLGFALFAFGDNIYVFQVASGTYHVGTLLDFTWPLGLAVLAFASWQQPREQAEIRLEGWAVLVMPALFAMAGAVVADPVQLRPRRTGAGDVGDQRFARRICPYGADVPRGARTR